jgi:hypothetical protein
MTSPTTPYSSQNFSAAERTVLNADSGNPSEKERIVETKK